MTNLARIDLTQNPPAVVPDAAPWAVNVEAAIPPSSWPDLFAQGYPGIGYWPITVVTPEYDQETQQLGAPLVYVDVTGVQVIQTWTVITKHSAANAILQNYVARLRGQAGLLIRQGKPAQAQALLNKAFGAQING